MTRRWTVLIAALSLAGLVVLGLVRWANRPTASSRAEAAGPYPSDWFGLQRAFPTGEIPQQAWRQAVERARVDRAATRLSTSSTQLTWTLAGPTNIGGRVTAIAADPTGVPAYFGAANGGVFRSDDFGLTWYPIFDEVGVPSIGALAVDPLDSEVLYVGTGEANSSVDSYDGDGLYRTIDGGATWARIGLENAGRIARIAVDPQDPARLHVAVMGHQFSTGPERGLYRSIDGGVTWQRALFVNDSTGACDVVVNPAHPETVYCATWERVRRPTYRRAYGPGCGIWRSVDAGATWAPLAGGLPVPADSVGRIGLAVAPSRPSTVYAQIVRGIGPGNSYTGLGMFRSDDGGDTWSRRDLAGFTGNFGGFGWYFGDCAVDPADADRVWALGVPLMQSTDGGVNFVGSTYGHVDQHALWISPVDPNRMLLGNDGGIWRSIDGGATITFPASLPITQFYAGSIDPSNPNRLLGGTQDNNTLLTHTGSQGDWLRILGGDGFYCLVDPTDPNVILAEWQFCCGGTGPRRSTNGGASFSGAPSGIVGSDRFNWSTPFVMDPSDHNVVLLGSQRVYRSANNGVSYAPISGDLTTSPSAAVVYGTITTLDISPLDGTRYYAGTDDGRVWRTTDAGGVWTDVSAGLPTRWVTRVAADPADAATVYVTLSGFTQDEGAAHVFRSADGGDTWTSIGADLPNVPVNDLIAAPWDPQTLFVATDVGVYATRNLGATWFPLGQGLPLQAVNDLSLHAPSRTLVAATHGRSQWRLDLNELPVAVEPNLEAPRLTLGALHPNPARGPIRATLEVPAATTVEITIYDVMGREVERLHRGQLEAGRHTFTWNGTHALGRHVAAGAYFLRASSPAASVTRRFVRLD